MLFDPRTGADGLEQAMASLCAKASAAVAGGATLLVISDRGLSRQHAPIPALLATAGVHHHLVREGSRTRCALIIETGEARECHHMALLVGSGAAVINPYLALETIGAWIPCRRPNSDPGQGICLRHVPLETLCNCVL